MRTMEVLIVDDDIASRRGLRHCINWNAMNMRVCGEAKNGREALALVGERKVDIVLSDVKMPFMDGLELSYALADRYPAVKVLLISGYGEIDYLKSAIDAQVLSYILKPVNVSELETSLKKAAAEIMEDERAQRERAELAEKLKRSLPLLQERFLQQLMENGYGENGEIMEQAKFLGMDFPDGAVYFVMVVRAVREGGSEMETQLASLRLGELIGEFLAGEERRALIVSFGRQEFALLCISASGDDRDEIPPFATRLLAWLRSRTLWDIDIGMGLDVVEPARICLSYHIAKQALFQSYFEGHNALLYAHHAQYETDGLEAKWDGGQKMETHIRQGNAEEFSAYLDRLFDQMQAVLPMIRAQLVCRRMLLVAMKLAFELEPAKTALYERAVELIGAVAEMDTFHALKRAVKHYLLDAMHALSPEGGGYKQQLVEQIIAVITERYGQNLTIRELAEAVHYSPTYIACIFREQQGETINDYITRYRMQKAAEHMRDPRLRLYEIVQMVGYSDQKYFARLFRKYYGLTPSEYRDSHAAGEKL